MKDDLSRMEQNIPFILCKLERIFHLGFFYSMEHLSIHLHMKLDLVDQPNIDGCIHLKGNKMIIEFYLKFICLMVINHDLVLIKICRFMGNSKQAVKNKAKVVLDKWSQ